MKTSNAWMRQTYDRIALDYRRSDDLHVTCGDHQRLCGKLISACQELHRATTVLDLGCGTGRHFHCLRNVRKLVAVDISPEMLKQAQTPVLASEIQVGKIELVCSDIYSVKFPPGSFDLIFSLGVFGNGVGLTLELAQKLYEWLTPEGILVFDAANVTDLPRFQRLKKLIRWRAYQVLPTPCQKFWNRITHWPPVFYCSLGSLARLLKEAGFSQYTIEEVRTTLPNGMGSKFEILARKTERTN